MRLSSQNSDLRSGFPCVAREHLTHDSESSLETTVSRCER